MGDKLEWLVWLCIISILWTAFSVYQFIQSLF